jgi:hypothetical protein
MQAYIDAVEEIRVLKAALLEVTESSEEHIKKLGSRFEEINTEFSKHVEQAREHERELKD